MKKDIKKMLSSRRGFSMTEVVIGLVIIGIISAAAVMLSMYSVKVEKQTFSTLEAKYTAENILACFRYSENESEFIEAINKTATYEEQDDGSLVLDGNGYTVTVKADFTYNYFEYYAVDADGNHIYSFKYPYSSSQGGAS